MFTGIIEAVGTVRELKRDGVDLRLVLEAGPLDLSDVAIGESISVSGACLTATAIEHGCFAADVSRETLEHTTLGELEAGSRVNLERAATPASRLGGHLVSGHVDGVGTVESFAPEGRSRRLGIRVPEPLARYVARKGSVCVDGVSLTVNEVEGSRFGVNIVPHTLAGTTIGDCRPGRRVNLEVDVVARYLERLVQAGAGENGGGLDLETLARHGFLQPRGERGA
ncbi:MAG TPA: riboflavin synthase [Gammaproteobacteria bacterium]|nr:riboflavin synthase [Gammaproteobacteria bacterium]